MLDDARIAVVVPAHNEALLIASVIESMPSYVDHIVVVDDASEDDTGSRAAACGDARVQVVTHVVNRGVGAAIATGYRVAREAGADVVAVMAGDNQMHPDDLLAVVRPVAEGQCDYVKGDRLHHPDVRRMPLARRVGSAVLAVATRYALGLPSLSDSQCGFTAIAGHAIDELELYKLWPRFGYPNDLLGLLVCRGMRIREVVVRPVYANEKSELRVRHVVVIAYLIARAAVRQRLSRQVRGR